MKKLTDEQVRAIFNYEEATGVFTIADPSVFITKGCPYTKENVQTAISVHVESRTKGEHLKVSVYGQQYVVAKLIWQFVYGGGYPKQKMLHVDGDTLNNRISNLKLLVPRIIDIEYIKRTIEYNPVTGIFTKTQQALRRKGKQTLLHASKSTGYHNMNIDGRQVSAQQVAFVLMTGNLPEYFVDHRDGNKSNNKWDNLREVTEAENSRNQKLNRRNKTGQMGVFRVSSGSYAVQIADRQGKKLHLGTYKTLDEAIAVRKVAEVSHGYSENHGRPGND